MLNFAGFHKSVVKRLILSKTTCFSENPMPLLGQSHDAARCFVGSNERLFHKHSGGAKAAKGIIHGPFITGVSESFEILNIQGAKGSDVGHGMELLLAQGIGSVLIVAFGSA
jgi:hypothetical protein